MLRNTFAKFWLFGSACVLSGIGIAQTTYPSYTAASEAARVQFESEDYQSAQMTMEQALALAKTPTEQAQALIRLGRTYNARKLYPQAREQWERVLQLPGVSSPDQIGALAAIATAYNEQNDWNRANAEFEKILATPEATPEDKTVARLGIALNLANQRKEAEARRAFTTLAQDPTLDAKTRATAYIQIAASFSRVKQFDRARTALSSALELQNLPAEVAVTVQDAIAQSYQDNGDTVRAQVEFGNAQSAALAQFKALSTANQFPQARAMMELFLDSGHVSPWMDAAGRMQIGYLLQKEGQSAQARTVFQAVTDKQYQEVLTAKEIAFLPQVRQSAQLAIAQTYAEEGNKTQAQQVLKTLLASNNVEANVQTAAQELLKSLS